MKVPTILVAVTSLVLCLTPVISVAQTRGPVPVREAEVGLLSQASISPAHARLAAFGAFPGAMIIAAEIRREESRLAYVFDMKFDGNSGTDRVKIDALTGKVLCLDYAVERDHAGDYIITGPDELMSLVKASFAEARATAEAALQGGRVVGCRLIIQQSREYFMFDIDVGAGGSLEHVSIDAQTGAVISAPAT